jgi:Leucine-rich repeat (LRR) protein
MLIKKLIINFITKMSTLLKKGNLVKIEEKPKIAFIKSVDESIKTKLYSIASKGYGSSQPKIITIEEIKKAIGEWKLENQIYSQEITLGNCLELSLSFQKILQIANLENLVKLEKLKLDNNLIMKIENLDELVNIKWLDLSFNFITVIEGLNSLVNLEDLSLYNNQISEVGGLDNCKKLNVLSIGRNNINNPKGVKLLILILASDIFKKVQSFTSFKYS